MLDQDIVQRLIETGNLITIRRGERIVAGRLGGDTAIVVIAGVAAIESHLDTERRQIHAFAFPRELVCLEPFEAMPELAVTATVETRFCRVRPARYVSLAEEAGRDSEPARLATALRAEQVAFLQRQAVHAATLGRLTGEERVATLLLELALANGRRRGEETTFDLVMTRADMADYLDLNADTLSRVLSRLRTAGVLSLEGRTEARVGELATLASLTPLAEAVKRMRRRDT